MFKEQLGKTMEVYINDMLAKSTKKEDHIGHLKEAFEILRQYRMKLNPKKYAFGITSGKFLGFLVSQRGIEVNPDQIRAIDAISEILTSKKQVQKLTGRVAALSRFISWSSDRCHKFFNVLRKDHRLQWNEECVDALRKPKMYLSSPPLLVKVDLGECLLMYLEVSEVAVSAVLVRENEGAFTQICKQEVIAFIWKNIICYFGIPKEINCDNGPQFVGKRTTEFFEKCHIKRILSMPYHPAGNGQAESSNKVILNILKKKLEDTKGLWLELLPKILWAYRTTPKTSTGEISYSLVYETDVVILVEVGEPSLRYSNESGPSNDESRLQNLDKVEELRDMAHIRMVAQKQQVERYYNKWAKVRPLKVGDYILKAKTQAAKDPNEGKLGTNWDGPYKITAAANKGAFQLETMEGKLTQNN
ncbi:uncharacterized protein [Nicotiana sylvestris]|uniref:uncharacterized protein n=1 Tax=Nicotiana sylvestris TaxID=4096 RepID=UPI00388C7033